MALLLGCGDATSTGGNGGGTSPPTPRPEVPAPACTPAPGGGSATVRAPTLVRGLRDEGGGSWRGAPCVVDLDGDGRAEVVAARETRVVVWRADGTRRWGAAPTGMRVWAPPVVVDLVGDDDLEVAVGSGDRVVAYTAAGAVVQGFPARWRGEVRGLAAGDLDADGAYELVATTTQSRGSGGAEDVVTAFRATGAVARGFPPNASGASRCDSACDIAGAFDQNVALAPLDDRGGVDVVAPTDNAYASWHRGDGEAFPAAAIFRRVTRVPGVRFFSDYADAQRGYATNEASAEQAHFTNTAPTVADLDGDGALELVLLGSIQNAAQTDRRRGVGLFVVRPDGTRPAAWTEPFRVRPYVAGLEDFDGVNVVGSTQEVAVADLDPASPGLEMVFAGYDGRVWCVGADRSARWSAQFTTARDVLTAGALVVDLSGDGRPEVVFATYSPTRGASALYVLDARGATLHRVALPGRGAMSVPAAGDLDGDGALELVVNLTEAAANGDEALVFTVPGSSTQCMPWPMARRTPRRDGYVPARR